MATDLNLMRELHHRQAEGLDVRLLWHPRDDRVVVAVDDSETGERFTVDVQEGERPLEVFHHPFAFAAAPRALRHPSDEGRAPEPDRAPDGARRPLDPPAQPPAARRRAAAADAVIARRPPLRELGLFVLGYLT